MLLVNTYAPLQLKYINFNINKIDIRWKANFAICIAYVCSHAYN